MSQSLNIEEMLKQAAEGSSFLYSIVSVKDLCRNSFQGVRAVETTRVAERDFKYLVENDPVVSKDPQDFELIQLGVFNLKTGVLNAVDHIRLARGLDFVKK